MADPQETAEETPKKKSKLPFILGFVLAMAGAGGGFYAVQSGLLFADESHVADKKKEEPLEGFDMADVAFVPIEPLVVSMGQGSNRSHLRFRAQLEVGAAYKEEVEMLMPRVVDVLNGYLRALETSDLESSSILVRLRAQMLRRIQIVTGASKVNDLLIMEFVLN